jgi:hypothetical protein
VTPEPIDLLEERLNAAGKKVQRKGDTLVAQCPAHDDNLPSLSVAVGSTRDVVLYCHAGCRSDDVLAALSLTFKDFAPATSGDWVAEWIYRDERRRPLFRVVKLPGKQFRQHALDETTGEWLPSMGNVRRVLYRLPEIIDAVEQGETIWIAEGEKDVDRLVREGVQATCNPGGAKKFRGEYVTWLRGAREVVLVADRDATGLEHVEQIAEFLTAADIPWRVVQAAKGKDAYDHFTLGCTIDEFVDVTPGAGTIEAPNEQLERAHLVEWEAFWLQDHTDEDWLAWPIAPRGRTIAVYAPAKAGKSTIVLAIVGAAVTGRAVLGDWVPKQKIKVLYLDYEMNEADLYERLTELGYGPQDDLSGLHYALLPSLPPLDTPEGAEELLRLATHLGVDLVVVDTFGRAVEGGENDADTVRAFYRHTAQRLKQQGISVLRTDHSGKDLDKGQRGSSAKNDDVDVVFRLTRTETGVKMSRTHSRVTWVPDVVDIDRIERPDGIVAYEVAKRDIVYPTGTMEIVERLDRLDIPVDLSTNKAVKALHDHNRGARRQLVIAAQQFRKRRAHTTIACGKPVDNVGNHPGNHPGTTSTEPLTGTMGTTPGNPVTTPGTTLGTTGNHLRSHNGNHHPPLKGGVVPEAEVVEINPYW